MKWADVIYQMFKKETPSFTLKAHCKCGAEFYTSFCGPESDLPENLQDRYQEFLDLHRSCWSEDLENLPADWKV